MLLESIKNALGEELSKQVEAKLQESSIELAIMNDGSVVKADKHDGLKAEYNELKDKSQSDISEANKKIEEALKNAGDYEALKGTLENITTESNNKAAEYETELLNIKKNSSVDMALLEANIDKSYLGMVKSQINMEALTYEGDNLIGLTDSIKVAQETFPKLFGEIKKVGLDVDKGLNPQKTTKQQLIEQYNQAEKTNDARGMMSLDKQIRAIKE